MSPRGLRRRRVRTRRTRAGVAAWFSFACACSVYDSSDLGGWGGAAGSGGMAPPGNVAGAPPSVGGAGAGGGAGMATQAGSGGVPVAGAAGRGGSAPSGGSAVSGSAAEGGAPEPPGGGSGEAGEASAGGEPNDSGLVAYYPCEGASDGKLDDASGRGNVALLVNGKPDAPGFGFVDGVLGKALSLRSTSQSHVRMPRGIVSTFREVTVATWIKIASTTPFQRIFDFGVGTDTFMYLSSAGSSGLLRLRLTSASPSRNQALEGGKPLVVGTWAHVAVTVGDGGIALYQNGAQVAQQAPAALRPSELGDTTNNFIGRSPFVSDPYLDADLDEFRVFGRVLSPAEIADLARREGQ